jgi:hypothetical protein
MHNEEFANIAHFCIQNSCFCLIFTLFLAQFVAKFLLKTAIFFIHLNFLLILFLNLSL